MGKERKSGTEVVVIILYIVIVILIGYIIYDKVSGSNNLEEEKSKLIESSNYEKFKNYDGTYGDMEKIILGDTSFSYTFNLRVDGKVYARIFGEDSYISNVSDVIDILILQEEDYENAVCYMLTDTGNVYYYNTRGLFNKKYEAILIEDLENVDRLIEIHYFPSEGSNLSRGVVAVLENGNLVEL